MLMIWISKEDLPDSEETVLLHCPLGDDPVRVGFHDGEEWCDYNGAPLIGRDAVSHWMPLPDPPPALEVWGSPPSIGHPGFCGGGPPCKGEIEGRDGCIFDCGYNKYF